MHTCVKHDHILSTLSALHMEMIRISGQYPTSIECLHMLTLSAKHYVHSTADNLMECTPVSQGLFCNVCSTL